MGSLRTLLVGAPHIPTNPSTNFPSPLFKLFAVSLCCIQLLLYVLSAVGGVLVWAMAQGQGWKDPLKESLVGSLALEGWALVGLILGFMIFLISRRWAVPAGVEWGWMGIRLGLFVFVVLFVVYLLDGLDPLVNISLITSLCLFIPAPLFWQLGTQTLYNIKALSAEDFQIRLRHPLHEENVIFLSYRRQDSQIWTDRISDELKAHFGRKSVFQDVEAIPAGADFRRHLQTQLQNCQIVLVVIGPNWILAGDEQGNRRLDQQEDLVRLEIEIALGRKIPLIPLLVDEAKMPTQKELPESLKDLTFQNGLPIRGNPDFCNDMNRLIFELEKYLL